MPQLAQRKPVVTGAAITLLGAAMLWPALQLLLAGGTPYYLAASVLLVASNYYAAESVAFIPSPCCYC